MSNYFLEHYGVVGMRWGRRRARALNDPNVVELGPNEYRDAGGSSSRRSNNSNSGGGSSSRRTSGRTNRSTNDNSETRRTNNENTNSNTSSTASSSPKKVDLKSAQSGLKDGKKLADAGAKYLEDDRKKQTTKQLKNDARNMTDDELRTVINRLSMEERYVSVMEKQGVGQSKSDLQKTLEIIGTVAAHADTAISVYDRIQQVRGR